MTLGLVIPADAGTGAIMCGDASILAAHLSHLPAGSTVDLSGCYWITGPVHIHNTDHLTVQGNGATFTSVLAVPQGLTQPLLELNANRSLTLENFSVTGSYSGTNGGAPYEGAYGILAEANHGLTIRGVSISDVQGDFLNLQTDYLGGTGDLNTSVMVTSDHFTDAGYHGITIEAADGATFSHDTFAGMGPDAIDLESDIYSSNIAVGQGRYRAENNIDIRQNTWSRYTSDFFANIQPQLPGVQEQHVSLTNNAIANASPIAEVVGPQLGATTKPYLLDGLTISSNTNLDASGSTSGGSITVPFVGSAMTFANVVSLAVTSNKFPLFDGMPGYFENTPYLAAAKVTGSFGVNVRDNTFSGALGVLHPDSGSNSFVAECANKYGVGGNTITPACPAP